MRIVCSIQPQNESNMRFLSFSTKFSVFPLCWEYTWARMRPHCPVSSRCTSVKRCEAYAANMLMCCAVWSNGCWFIKVRIVVLQRTTISNPTQLPHAHTFAIILNEGRTIRHHITPMRCSAVSFYLSSGLFTTLDYFYSFHESCHIYLLLG